MILENLSEKYKRIRIKSEELCKPLLAEDHLVQSIYEVSPPKWHLAHITWFFETFILKEKSKNYKVFNPQYHYLFNSYYNSVGELYDKNYRGILSRPPLEDIYQYRKYVDENMAEFLENLPESGIKEIIKTLELGLNHEQQHQELLLMDIKNIFFHNPLKPAYQDLPLEKSSHNPLEWLPVEAGIKSMGHDTGSFCFDNELPRHKAYIHEFKIASRPVLNGEYLEFINSGGYSSPKYWLSDGWDTKNKEGWQAPLYWQKEESQWRIFTLNGLQPLDENEPVSHISYYEADAYSHWAGKRLPTEAEWETVAGSTPVKGNFMDNGRFHPLSEKADSPLQQLFGDCWEWTLSAYLPYPGFKSVFEGLGEYNGKFMINQMVLRGGCCATPADHIRNTYRNFFYPHNRWQFSGIRLADD